MTRPFPPVEGDGGPSGPWPPASDDPARPPLGWPDPPPPTQPGWPDQPPPSQPGWPDQTAGPWVPPAGESYPPGGGPYPPPWTTHGAYGGTPIGPAHPSTGPATARRPRPRRWPWVILVIGLGIVVGSGIWVDVAGVRTRAEHLVARLDLALHPPADRDTAPTIEVTPPPGEVADDDIAVSVPDPTDEVELVAEPDESSSTPARATAHPTPDATRGGMVTPRTTLEPTSAATPTPTPRPRRKPVRFRLRAADPKKFVSQVDNTMCAAAGLQMVLGMHDQVPLTAAFQRRLDGRLDEWESRRDAKAGGWGPSSMVEALAAYGVKGYEVRAYENRNQSLREAAAAMVRTGAPAILIAWRGAHTWVMTGFRADADPTVFRDARITGINVFDPWYPTVSTIWGPSDPPGTLQDLAEVKRNFLQWERPEGAYPDRDGKYIVVIPTIPLKEQRGDER